jgi:hypothetical protein
MVLETMKAYWHHSKSKIAHDWVRATRETFMATVCGTYKEKLPEELVTPLASSPYCKHCERMNASHS